MPAIVEMNASLWRAAYTKWRSMLVFRLMTSFRGSEFDHVCPCLKQTRARAAQLYTQFSTDPAWPAPAGWLVPLPGESKRERRRAKTRPGEGKERRLTIVATTPERI